MPPGVKIKQKRLEKYKIDIANAYICKCFAKKNDNTQAGKRFNRKLNEHEKIFNIICIHLYDEII